MDKKCIYDESKLCDNCGDCRCDLNKDKICNNCGKCLELDGYDIRAIRIDEIMEGEEDQEEIAASESSETTNDEAELINRDNEDLIIDNEKHVQTVEEINETDEICKDEVSKQEVVIDFINDIPELSELFEDEEKLKKMSQEIFPGLLKINIKE